MQIEIHVIDGPAAGRVFSVNEGQILTIGRGQASDTQINDPRMSRVHCQIEVKAGRVLILDKGSSSGTFIRGNQITEQELRPGDIIQVGDSKMRYQMEGIQEESTLAGTEFGRIKPPAKVAPLPDLVGQSLAHYRLDKIMTRGHSGMVFRATDTKKNTLVAVKVLSPEQTNSDEERQRFVRAMKTMLPIKHTNIVQLLNAGRQGPHCWAAMEFVDGESLADVIHNVGTAGMLEWRDVFRVAVHIGRALEHAAEHKIIHRNVTPQNILQRSSDKVSKLGDLMLAKALEGSLAQQVTQPGQLIGDVPYMSPERTRHASDVDARSDMYELGATLFALLVGRPPFEGHSLPLLIKQVREAEPEPPKKTHLSIPDQFQDIILKLLSKRPNDRFESPTKLLIELGRVGKFNGIEVEKL